MTKIFWHRRCSWSGGPFPINLFMLKLGWAAGSVSQPWGKMPHPDGQGHAYFRLC